MVKGFAAGHCGRGFFVKGLHMAAGKMRGFTLVELMITLTVFLIATMMITMAVQPALREGRVSQGYNMTLAAMRLARDTSVAQRQIYYVTLNNAVTPNTVTITQGSTGIVINTYTLPSDVAYQVLPQFPTSQTQFPTTPDGFGVGVTAIDLDQGIAGGAKNVVYFYPDGSAKDVNGNFNNGVVYVARAGDYYSARALTAWGATGRLRGWRMDTKAGTYYWRYQ
jgi:prepilin-type N-terminal cleavage/methylation domain-containing protein